MKKIWKAVFIILLVFVLGVGGMALFITSGLDKGASLVVQPVDASLLEDGVYEGKYEAGRWTNVVKVTVQDHRITQIVIVKDVMIPGEGASEQIFSSVIEKQNTDVDVVSGATVTSKAYLKAVENALSR